MESRFHLSKPNPRKSANFLSKLFFGWALKLFQTGTKRELLIQDLYKPLHSDESELLGDQLERSWENEKIRANAKNCKPNLFFALKNTFFRSYMLYGIIVLFRFSIIRATQPLVLAKLLSLFSDSREKNASNHDDMVFFGIILVAQTLIGLFIDNHITLELNRVGMRVRVACCSLVYRKVLKLNRRAAGQQASGQVINLLSNDVNRFDVLASVGHHLWITPIQTVILFCLLYQEVQFAAIAGVASMFLLTVPLNLHMGNLLGTLRNKIALKTDSRVRLMNEVINGIYVIKMYAWEKPFQYIVQKARGKEINYITKVSYIKGIFFSCMIYAERTASTSTLLCFVLLGNAITAGKVYSVVQYFSILQLSMGILCPIAYAVGAETITTVKRLESFLLLEEKSQSTIDVCLEKSTAIAMEQVTASWVDNSITLNNLNLRVPRGSFVAVVGPVGSGKSSLLQLLLGELAPDNRSKISLNGEVSYAAQEPWLFASTVRHNILFGQIYNQQRYKKVTEVCALKADFQQFPLGDLSLVGEKGVSLSGGQRARINLARAVYRQADIYLLDDPLSAVDSQVGKHLFQECILNYLTGKTRILVTHQLQYLKKADFIVVINEGKMEAKGTFEELSNNQKDFTKLLVAAGEQLENTVHKIKKRRSHLYNKSMCKRFIDGSENENQVEESGYKTAEKSTFFEYFKAGGSRWTLMTLCCILVVGQGTSSGSDFWMQFWVQSESKGPASEDVKLRGIKNFDKIDSAFSLNQIVYISLFFMVTIIFITLLRSILFFVICMTASKNLHHKMFDRLLMAPISFFTTNTSGRVLNRFSKDIGTMDEDLPQIILEVTQLLLIVGGIAITISILNYYMIAGIVLLGYVFWKLRCLFVPTAKDIRRLEGIAKSPVFSHVNTSLSGLTTIRVCKAQTLLKQEFDAHQDVHTSACYMSSTLSCAFGLWMDFFCVIFMASVTFSFILIDLTGTVSASAAGLAISQSIILMGLMQHCLRLTAEVVSQMTSVERILQYTNMDNEGPFDTPEVNQITCSWPQEGGIHFKNLSLKYYENDAPVLKQINVEILPGQKIGIVGRTGAGKSSIISALFRLAPIEGSIIIDGVNTQSIGLSDLRKHISIIPQEPILFSASIRYNLDVFAEFSDNELWIALEEVELKQTITTLDFMVEESGKNFSVGQRQLICLARAILRNNKILVLDEATANVDPGTDALIQETIRRKFSDRTVLTIAHRLHTIMDSDRIIVMDNGYMIEYDHPYNLLQNTAGYFARMVAESGSVMQAQFKNIAQESFQKTGNSIHFG